MRDNFLKRSKVWELCFWSVIATLIFLIAAGPSQHIFDRTAFGFVFDELALSLLDFRLDIPFYRMGFEAYFAPDGKTYTYFGLWPALVRLPIVLITDHFIGRLTRIFSCLIAVFTMMYVYRFLRLAWVAGGKRSIGCGPGVCSLLVIFASPYSFLISEPNIFHEVILWGVLGAVGALYHFTAAQKYGPELERYHYFVGSLFSAVALLSRPTFAIPFLGLIVFWCMAGLLQNGIRRGLKDGVMKFSPIVVAGLLTCAYNFYRFGSIFTFIRKDYYHQSYVARFAAESSINDPLRIPNHLLRYVFDSFPTVIDYFPYLEFEGKYPPFDYRYEVLHMEPVAGLVFSAPWLLLVFYWLTRKSFLRARLGEILPGFFPFAVIQVLVVASYFFLTQRYLVEIIPLAVFLLGCLASAGWFLPRNLVMVVGTGVLALFFNIIFLLNHGFNHYG